VTTSRSELPPVVLPGTRRFLPLRVVELLAPTFSFVPDASDLESSGGGLDFGGAMPRDEIDRIFEDYILAQRRGFEAMGHLATAHKGRGCRVVPAIWSTRRQSRLALGCLVFPFRSGISSSTPACFIFPCHLSCSSSKPSGKTPLVSDKLSLTVALKPGRGLSYFLNFSS